MVYKTKTKKNKQNNVIAPSSDLYRKLVGKYLFYFLWAPSGDSSRKLTSLRRHLAAEFGSSYWEQRILFIFTFFSFF